MRVKLRWTAPAEELRTIIHEHFKDMEEITRKHKPTDKNSHQYAEELLQHLMLAAFNSDALIQKLPDDPLAYEEIASFLFAFTLSERGLVYLEPLTRRFSENHATNLEQMADAQRDLSKKYFEIEEDERGERFLELAEQTLTELLAIEDTFAVRIALAEVLIERNERLDEAEEHLHRARTFTSDPADESHIELHLGEIAMEREQFEEALQHYQRVVELEPDNPAAWIDLAEAHKKLGNFEEAEANYRRAIAMEPANPDHYYSLSTMFIEQSQTDKAIETLEEGLSENPDSAMMNFSLAMLHIENNDYRQAEVFVKQAERLDPEFPGLKMINEIIKLGKQISTTPRLKQAPPKFRKQKKKRK